MLLFVIAALAGAVWLIYGGAIHSPLIYDDEVAVRTNRSLVQLWPLLGDDVHPGPLNPPPNNVTSGRPLVNLTFAINYHFGLLDTTGYHLFSLLVHAINATLLFLIVRSGLRSKYFANRYNRVSVGLPFAVALIWAVHPLQTDAVEYISQRTELMVACFYLLTLWASQQYLVASSTNARWGWLSLAAAACALGAGCKEVIVTAPLLVLLYDRTFESGSLRQALARNWPLYLGLLFSWCVLLALNLSGPRAETAGFHLGLGPLTWWFTQAKVLMMYCKLVFWPWPLIIHYHIPYVHSYWAALPWVAAAGALGLFVLHRLWQGTAVGYLGAWIFLILSPTMVVPIITEVAAERRLYLPLAAFVTLGVMLLYEVIVRFKQSTPTVIADAAEESPGDVSQEAPAAPFAAGQGEAPNEEPATSVPDVSQPSSGLSPLAITLACAGCLALVFAGVSRVRLQAYQDGITIFQDAVAHQPDDPVCTYTLALYLIDAGRPAEAIPHLRRTIELRREPPPQIDKYLGIALAATGQNEEAIERLQRAIKESPDDLMIRRAYSVALLNAGQFPEAIAEFEHIVKATGGALDDVDRLAAALLNAERADEAIALLQRVLQAHPELFLARFKLALAYANLHRASEAIAEGEKALVEARRQGAQEYAAQIHGWLNDFRNKATPAPDKPDSDKSAPDSPEPATPEQATPQPDS